MWPHPPLPMVEILGLMLSSSPWAALNQMLNLSSSDGILLSSDIKKGDTAYRERIMTTES